MMVPELLERAEERRHGTEKHFLRFRKDGHEMRWGLFPLYGGTGMRVENRDQIGDRSE